MAPVTLLRRRGAGEAGPHVAESGDERFDVVVAMQRARGQAQALGAARHGRVVDRLHIDTMALQQLVGGGLAENGVADQHRHDVAGGGNRSTRDRLVPYCVFTDPPLAHVGLSEAEAKRQGVAARVAKLPMKAVRRTATTDETQGFMKVLTGASDDRILGFTMIGAEAGEVMTVVQTAMLA